MELSPYTSRKVESVEDQLNEVSKLLALWAQLKDTEINSKFQLALGGKINALGKIKSLVRSGLELSFIPGERAIWSNELRYGSYGFATIIPQNPIEQGNVFKIAKVYEFGSSGYGNSEYLGYQDKVIALDQMAHSLADGGKLLPPATSE